MFCSTREFRGSRVKVGDDVLFRYSVRSGDPLFGLLAAKVMSVKGDDRVDLFVFGLQLNPRGYDVRVDVAFSDWPFAEAAAGTWCWPVATAHAAGLEGLR